MRMKRCSTLYELDAITKLRQENDQLAHKNRQLIIENDVLKNKLSRLTEENLKLRKSK